MISSLNIIYASSSGHTQHIVEVLTAFLKDKKPDLEVAIQIAEKAQPEDLTKGDVLILGSGTWNTGGIEGQLNMHMDALLKERAEGIDLAGKPCALIALGDDRYHYTCRATEHLMQFVMQHGGTTCAPPLLIVNEPYGQEDKIEKWGEKFLSILEAL